MMNVRRACRRIRAIYLQQKRGFSTESYNVISACHLIFSFFLSENVIVEHAKLTSPFHLTPSRIKRTLRSSGRGLERRRRKNKIEVLL